MKTVALLLIAVTGAFAKPNPLIILNGIFLNGDGPFRMLIDTGNTSSIIRPEIARRLNARAVYAVEHSTVAGTSIAPVVILDEVRAAGVTDRTVEAMVADTPIRGVDGVLGQSWLIRHDYLLDYQNHRIVVDGEPPADALRASLRTSLSSNDGRPIITVEIDGHRKEMVLDSGASTVVLFEPGAVHGALALLTNNGSNHAEDGCAKIAVEGDRPRRMKAVRVHSAEPAPGLLPASAFSAVYISNRHGYVELWRTPGS